jgi:hypothetical protein
LTDEGHRCADRSLARAEEIFGTASFVKRWLMLEQPGAWGPDALTQSRLPASFVRELRRRARDAGVRVILIRRGARFESDGRTCYFARTDGVADYLAQIELSSVDELLDLDLSPLRRGGAIEGPREAGPLFLVCTHGRHDACCSVYGNPVSRVACAQPGMDAWECSHIGGDRFAANLVCFPHGIYYGRVQAGSVTEMMEDHRRGLLRLDNYRGRCSQPFPIQAAEYFLRRRLGELRVEGLSLHAWSPLETGVRARFELIDGGAAEVEVAVDLTAEEHQLTCKATRTHPIPKYELVSISEVS